MNSFFVTTRTTWKTGNYRDENKQNYVKVRAWMISICSCVNKFVASGVWALFSTGLDTYIYMHICDRLQENQAQRGTLRKKFFLHLQSCRRPDIEFSKFYRHSLSRSHYNRPNRSLPSAWNYTFLRNRSIFSRYLRTPRCARFSRRRSHNIYILTLDIKTRMSSYRCSCVKARYPKFHTHRIY